MLCEFGQPKVELHEDSAYHLEMCFRLLHGEKIGRTLTAEDVEIMATTSDK